MRAKNASRTVVCFVAAAVLAIGAGIGIGAKGGAAGPPVEQRAGYIHVEGAIDRLQARYLARALADARAAGLDALIVHLDTDGGEVRYAREMFKDVLSPRRATAGPGANPTGDPATDLEGTRRKGEDPDASGPGSPGPGPAGRGDAPRMIAFVDYRALSAGAMIAYAHHDVYLTEGASIGDIGVIFRGPDGTIEYAPEKIETVIRTLLAQAAEQRGWPRGPLLKMTARNQNLYRITPPGGEAVYVIEDDSSRLARRSPGGRSGGSDPDAGVPGARPSPYPDRAGGGIARHGHRPRGRLPALYARLGIDPEEVVNLRPGAAERTAAWLAGIAPLLMGVALLLLFFEINTPGVGIWAVLATVFGSLFLFSHYYLDLVEHFEVALLVLGLGLIAVEILLMSTAGVLAVAGGLCLLTGVVLAFLPNEIDLAPSDPSFQAAFIDAALSGGLALVVVAGGLLLLFKVVPHAARLRPRLTVEAEITGTSGTGSGESLIGRLGQAEGALRPAGTVVVGGVHLSARAEHGTWIGAGEPVEVLAAELGEVVVRPARRPPARETP